MSGLWEEISATLDLVDEREPVIRALVPEVERRKRIESELAAAGRPTGAPLDGIAVGVKDLIHVDGLPTRAGSALPPERLAGLQATVVDRLRAAGAVVLGKTTTTEFAFQEPAATTNPRDPAHTPGGSSSGSAAAVAAGYTPLALGTQTVDSIVTPAAYCGVVGFKPTYGRVPVDGVIPFAPSSDHVGIIAVDVAMVRSAAPVIADAWVPSTDGRIPHVAVPTGSYLDRVDQEALAAFRSTLDDLAATGWAVSEVPALADIDAIAAEHRRLIAAEFAQVHDPWFRQYGERYRPRTAALIEEGRGVPSPDAAASRARAGALRETLTARLDALGADAWVAPAATGKAPRGLDAIGSAVMGLPWTSAHLPVITIPSGWSADDLPLGLQIVVRPAQDELLVEIAATAEAALGETTADRRAPA